jgi:hypothetical protein
MRALLQSIALLLVLSAAARAQAQLVDPELFGDGKPPVFRQEDTDRRFLKTGINAALSAPPKDPACRRVLATLLVAYSDALVYLHRKDQNFYVDPTLLQTFNRGIVTSDFPATAYLAAMIRRTLIEKKVPEGWVQTAETLRGELQAPIAVARMKLDADAVQTIDSFSFTIPALLDRYAREVKLAPSVSVDAAEDKFRDKYMDRDIAWGGLVLHDVAQQAPPEPPRGKKGKGKGKGKKKPPPPEVETEAQELPTWAVVGFVVGKAQEAIPGLPGSGHAAPQLEIRARLKDGAPLEVGKLTRGERVLIKGHLWDVATNLGYVEVRDATLLPDPDWSSWAGLASPRDVAACNLAVNDLSPYGYKKRESQAPASNPFSHGKE